MNTKRKKAATNILLVTFGLIVIWLTLLFINSIGDQASPDETGLSINESLSSKESYTFIIYIKTIAEAKDYRDILREKSWLSHDWTNLNNGTSKNMTWKYFFLIGFSIDAEVIENLKEENNTHGDILLSDTFSFYGHQIYKLMWMFAYVTNNYDFKFLVQVDDDVVVHINLLSEYLAALIDSGQDSFFYGGVQCGAERYPLREGKWKLSEDTWSPDVYPGFCSGAGIIYSLDSVYEILNIWKNYRAPIVGYDDVMMGIMVYLSRKIEATEVEGVTLGYRKGNDKAFMLLAIKPLEVGASLIENYLKTGIYSNESVFMHG